MASEGGKSESVEVVCPCCGARLKLDASLRRVISHEAPARPRAHSADLDHAAKLLEKEKARREALFSRSREDEKVKSQLLEKKFEESLKKAKDEPATPPLRDMDLD
jgi:hypothetical protein